jgi:hypothetical protein
MRPPCLKGISAKTAKAAVSVPVSEFGGNKLEFVWRIAIRQLGDLGSDVG